MGAYVPFCHGPSCLKCLQDHIFRWYLPIKGWICSLLCWKWTSREQKRHPRHLHPNLTTLTFKVKYGIQPKSDLCLFSMVYAGDGKCNLMDRSLSNDSSLNHFTSRNPFISIFFFSEIEWKLVGVMLSHSEPKHLSSLSPECPIRANVIAHIIMCGFGGGEGRFHSCVYRICSMTEQPEWFNYTNLIG